MGLLVIPKTRSSVAKMLSNRHLTHPYSRIFSYLTSPTIGRLTDMATDHPEKYKQYIQLIDLLLNIKKGSSTIMVLHLPPVDAMIAVDLETLLMREDIRRLIVLRCYHPEDRVIDLRPLVTIERRHRPDIVIPKN